MYVAESRVTQLVRLRAQHTVGAAYVNGAMPRSAQCLHWKQDSLLKQTSRCGKKTRCLEMQSLTEQVISSASISELYTDESSFPMSLQLYSRQRTRTGECNNEQLRWLSLLYGTDPHLPGVAVRGRQRAQANLPQLDRGRRRRVVVC